LSYHINYFQALDILTKQKLNDFLLSLITEERKTTFEKVLNFRTRHISVVLENIYQSHNASAVLRSCDLTGIQDIHILENKNEYNVNPEVAMGSAKWLHMYKYFEEKDNTLKTINHLKSQGYKIIATTPHENSYTPETLPLDNKCALLFGTELTGLSDVAIENADEFLTIPQFGFTESYNISVSVAISLYTLINRLHDSNIDWHLSDEEKLDLRLNWSRASLKRIDIIEQQFLKNLK
jgi:tRNA (guanosine-2'-O-)-methyltransferase